MILPLDSFRRVHGLDPWHFWGWVHPTLAPIKGKCDDVVYEFAWQGNEAAGRADVRTAIEIAENNLETLLGYSVGPRWREDVLAWPAPLDSPLRMNAAAGIDGRWPQVTLLRKRIIAIGTEKLTLLATPVVSLSPTPSDSVLPTQWSVSFATTVTDASQIEVYHSQANRPFGEPPSDKYIIAPVVISFANGICTIRGAPWVLASPQGYEFTANTTHLNPADPSNYVSTVEVYTRTTTPDGATNTTSQATLIWESSPLWWGVCSSPEGIESDPAAQGYALARAALRDPRNGVAAVGQAVFNSTTGVWSAVSALPLLQPSRVAIRYCFGEQLRPGHLLRSPWDTVVARLAAAEMGGRNLCACETARKSLHHWSFDLSRTEGTETYQAIAQEDLKNPLGLRRGQLDAWRHVDRGAHLDGWS